jgi:hypothetical protein
VLTELDPSGRARGNHLQCAAVLYSSKELGCLFHNGQVSRQVHVINTVKSKTLQRGNHLALAVGTGLIAKALADLSANRRSGTNENVLVRICNRIHNLVRVVSLVESANGTCHDTLTAIDTAGLAQALLKNRTDVRIEASVICSDYTNSLYLLTCGNATTAKNALIVVTNDGGRVVDLISVPNTAELVLIHTVLIAELLKLAGRAANAGETLTVVVGKKQLQVGLSGLHDLGSIGQNLHSLGYGIYASGYQTEGSATLGHLNKAQTAGADLVDILQITKSGDINLSGSCSLQNRGSLRNSVRYAVDLNINGFHCPLFSFLIPYKLL